MASLSNYLENELLDHLLDTGNYSVPSAIYIALGTACDDASLTECSGGSYARVEQASGSGWNSAASRAITNNGVITFPQATGSWGTVTHYAIFDASSGGNMLAWGALSASKSVVSGNTPSIADEGITVTFSAGGITTYAANKILDHVFGNATWDVSAETLYVGLSTTSPTDAGDSETEPGNGYARELLGACDVAASGASENSAEITFNAPSGSWGLITHVFIADALTAGNIWFWSTTTPNQTPSTGDTVKYAAGAIDITLD